MMPSEHKPVISIITPTFNRQEELKHLIPSLQVQTVDHRLFEFIISDDGSTDGTESRIAKWESQVDFPLRYITQKNKGPGAARNHGLEEARGELFLFIDSDCEAHPGWIEAIWTEFNQNKFDACGGPDGAKTDFTPLQKAIDYAMTSFFTTGGMRGHSEKMLAKFYPRSHNMGMTRTLYNKVGGFGSLRHGQDIELSHRIHKAGATVAFIPDAKVYHRRRTSIKRFFRQVFNWGVARVNLGQIDPALLEPIHFLPSLATVVGMLICLLVVLSPAVGIPLLLLCIGLLLLLAIHGGIKHRSFLTGIYLPIIIPVQISGYGLGFIMAWIRRGLGKQEPWTGFTKKYYS